MTTTRAFPRTLVVTAALALGTVGCASSGLPDTLEPDVAAAAIRRTAPDRPLRAIFNWVILDGQARFTGSGAARIEAPYLARLDLFGPTGEGYLSAALAGEELRLPAGTPPDRLPPPAMLWAALGVVRPPGDAVLVGTRVAAERTELYYDLGERSLRYTISGGWLTGARLDGPGRRMTLTLEGRMEPGLPREAFFRDPSAGMELRLNVERVDEVEPHPPEVWWPDA